MDDPNGGQAWSKINMRRTIPTTSWLPLVILTGALNAKRAANIISNLVRDASYVILRGTLKNFFPNILCYKKNWQIVVGVITHFEFISRSNVCLTCACRCYRKKLSARMASKAQRIIINWNVINYQRDWFCEIYFERCLLFEMHHKRQIIWVQRCHVY